MARNEVLSRLRKPEKMEGADELTSSSPPSFSSSSPLAAAAATANSESQEEIHVLAVDDNLIDRKVIEKLLKIISCKVTAVDSGRRALQFLGLDEEKNSVGSDEGKKVDMIITDYCMPGMTGFELLKKIKSSAAFRQVPVVIMSSENILARIDSCFEEGAEDFIMKPVKLADVKRLKDSMYRKLVEQETEICKRKLQVTCDNVSSTNDPLPKTAATTPSPPSSTSSSPPSSPKSFSSSSSSSSAPSADLSPPTSPTTILNSQTRRLKISNYDLK